MILSVNDVEQDIDNWVSLVEAKGFSCPKENKKNSYLKACWLLSRYKKMQPSSPSGVVFCREFIAELEEAVRDLGVILEHPEMFKKEELDGSDDDVPTSRYKKAPIDKRLERPKNLKYTLTIPLFYGIL